MLAKSSNDWKNRGGKFPTIGSWKQKFVGYESEEILTRQLKTSTNGEASFTFTPGREGYFMVTWNSPQRGGAPVSANCSVWATTEKTGDLGYNRQGGVEIIVDKDTFRAGENAAVMLVSPVSDRWVLFSVEGDDLYNYDVIHLDGTVKLVQFPVEEKHVPNIFLTASSFSDGECDLGLRGFAGVVGRGDGERRRCAVVGGLVGRLGSDLGPALFERNDKCRPRI
jgi:uncharacterized protein YfaS (alpha-2-macroglobulin family)